MKPHNRESIRNELGFFSFLVGFIKLLGASVFIGMIYIIVFFILKGA